MSVKPASGYYDFSISVDGDKRFIANKVEVGVLFDVFSLCAYSLKQPFIYTCEGCCQLYGIFITCFSVMHWILTQDYGQ